MASSTRIKRLTPDEATELWAEYKRTSDPRLKDRLVLTFAPMVKYIVYRKVREIPARCEIDDFISAGLEALIRSIDRYDPEKGASLERFAWTRIHGAVLDELRRTDWAPRSLRRWDRDITKTRDDFTRLYNRRPSNEELSTALGITPRELADRLDQISRTQIGSLNVLVLGEEETAIEKIDTLASDDHAADPEAAMASTAARDRLLDAVQSLPERDRKVALLLYVYNLTLREIGQVIGVSESRVCQLHGQILQTLRARLKDDEQLFAESLAVVA